jgi:serine/threonine protein kinase
MTGNGGAPEGMWSSPQDLVGTILADRYQVQKVIGDGGMGSVFLAEHVTLRKKVALKVLHPELCRDQTHVDRFLQEARAASMINHENIVDIVDFGPVPGGSVFFAMEYLEGHDLSGALRKDGRMPWPRVQNFMLQIVRALKAAHQKGIIHRDLKPANCFVVTKPDGREFIKLLDFGIAKVTDSENDKGLTRTGAVFGTAKYMAPEQACGEAADQRTDIYATAVLMYELLTGVVPFDGDNFMRVLSRHLTEPLTLPSTMAPDAGIPPMVESIVVKALSKKREDRYQTMTEFEEALLALGPDGTLRNGMGMGALAYSAPMMTNPGMGSSATLPLNDAPGQTQWLGPQASQGPVSQPPEGRGGTLLLDGDSAPPGFMNQPGVQGPTHWSSGPPGGTLMMDGMGQDILPGPGGAAITRNPPMMGSGMGSGMGMNPGMMGSGASPETRPPGSDPNYAGDADYYAEPPSRKGLLLLVLGGAVAAIGLGGLVAWLMLDEPVQAPTPAPATQVATKTPPDPDPKTPDPKTPPDPDPKTPPDPDPAEDDGELKIEDDGGTPTDTSTPPDPDPDPDPDPVIDPDPVVDPPEPKTPRTPKTPKTPPKTKDVRDAKDLSKGFGKAAKAAKACGKTHGAIPGQSIAVEAAIKSGGQILSANATGLNRSSPLGKCVAEAVKNNARFVPSNQALQTEKFTYKM